MPDEQAVQTIAGAFNRKRIESLRDALDAAEQLKLDKSAVIKFEGADLVVGFGKYLLEYLDVEMPK